MTARRQAEAGAGKGLGSALGGFRAKLDSIGGNASGDSSFTALWIEYKITSPGREEVVRREVFDLTGPATASPQGLPEFELSEEDRIRRAAALLTVTDITVLPGSPSAPFMLLLRKIPYRPAGEGACDRPGRQGRGRGGPAPGS